MKGHRTGQIIWKFNVLKCKSLKQLEMCLSVSFIFIYISFSGSYSFQMQKGGCKNKIFFLLYPFHILPWLKLWRFKMHSFKYNMAWNYSFKSMVHQNSKKSFKDILPLPLLSSAVCTHAILDFAYKAFSKSLTLYLSNL